MTNMSRSYLSLTDPIVVARCDRAYAVRDGKITHELSREELDAASLSDKYDRTAMDGIY